MMQDQARSRFLSPEGQLGVAQVLAEIFFPTNSSTLDYNDQEVLIALATYIRLLATRKRVELMIIGYTDHKGKAKYNQKLGKRRAISVVNLLELQLRAVPGVSLNRGLSKGESNARTDATRDEMARDRRVEVWDAVPDFWTPPAEPKIVAEQVDRPTHIDLSKNSFERINPNRGKDIDYIKDLMDFIFKKGAEKVFDDAWSKYGSVESIRFQKMNAHWRVNKVHIKQLNSIEMKTLSGTYFNYSTKITYYWGPPSAMVRIGTTTKVEVNGSVQSENHQHEDISRSKADKDPFTFPPAKKSGSGGKGGTKTY